MYQSFEVTARPEQGPPRLEALRREIAGEGLDGFLVPRADAHQGEYVAAHDDRLAWLTGFTGSAGFCAALKDIAGVFIDGRYRIIGQSKPMRGVYEAIEKVADTPSTVLITGESGTGKELMARAIHHLSQRTGPFKALNAAGVDDMLFSDTLFGTVHANNRVRDTPFPRRSCMIGMQFLAE